MNTRVRFTKQHDTGLMLTKEYVAGTKMVQAVLDLANKRISIYETGVGNIIALVSQDHPDKSLSQLKKLTKPLLESLGVIFYNETRETSKMVAEEKDGEDAHE